MVNHKEEAEGLFDRGSRYAGDGSYSFANDTETLLAAQVQATLYLAEQQRVANLIAVFAEGGLFNKVDALGYKDWDEFVSELKESLGR